MRPSRSNVPSDIVAKAAGDEERDAVLQSIRNWLLAAAAAGAGTRAAVGLGQMATGGLTPPPRRPQKSVVVDLPYRYRPTDPLKAAGDGEPATLAKILAEPKTWLAPAMFLGAPAAAAGSYSLVDKLLRWRKRRALQGELDDARDEYRGLVLGTHRPLDPEKLAANFTALIEGTDPPDPEYRKVAAALETVADAVEVKRAADNGTGGSVMSWLAENIWPWRWAGTPKDWSEPMGAYLTAAGGIAGLGGLAGYHYARERDPERAKAKAVSDELEAQVLNRPPSVYGRLVPVDESGRPVRPAPARLPQKAAALDPQLQERARGFVERLLGRRGI